MVKVLLILAAIVDVALAVLLIGVSGFLFGAGPESMHSGAVALLGYAAAVIACVVAPIFGFILTRRGKPTPGVMIALMPAARARRDAAAPPY